MNAEYLVKRGAVKLSQTKNSGVGTSSNGIPVSLTLNSAIDSAMRCILEALNSDDAPLISVATMETAKWQCHIPNYTRA